MTTPTVKDGDDPTELGVVETFPQEFPSQKSNVEEDEASSSVISSSNNDNNCTSNSVAVAPTVQKPIIKRRPPRQSFRASLALNQIRKNKWLNLAWAVFKVAPPVLSSVGLALAIYALVDFAAFAKDYKQLQDEIDQQSQQDFDLINFINMEKIRLILSIGQETDTCQSQDETAVLNAFLHVINLMKQAREATERVTFAYLPPGTLWKDHLVERFPSVEDLSENGLPDYSNFANPTRFGFLAVYGTPDMEPLFRAFRASLVFDIVSVVVLVGPALILWRNPGFKYAKALDKGILLLDIAFLFVSVILLGITVRMSSSTSGYDVGIVQGRASFFETSMWNDQIKEGLNPHYWGQIPQKFCNDTHLSCHPENSYQPGCSAAQINVTVPREFLMQDGDQWYVELEAQGTSIVEKNISKIMDSIFRDDQHLIDLIEHSFNLPIAIPQDIQDVLLYYKDAIYTSACRAGSQEFVWTDEDLQTAMFPTDDPDYNHVCNAQCEHDWNNPDWTSLSDCPPGCTSPSCGCVYSDYSTCSANCPTIDTADTCGCLAFGYALWNYDCSSRFPVITDENYNRFTSFAVENVQEGLMYDIAATAIDFVAICLVAISIFVPSIRKMLNKDQEIARSNSDRSPWKKTFSGLKSKKKKVDAFGR